MRSGPVSEATGIHAPMVASRSALVLDPAALHGLPGEMVRVLEPVTEAAPAAVLITALTIFGAAVGPDPYMLADGGRHGAHLYAAIVGKTARARKGTSYRVARGVLQHADRGLFEERTFGGFGSGEALIEAVGGGDEEKDADDDGSHRNAAPPHDPRALIVEEELARIFRVAEREGSTLSPILRQAFDGGYLSVITRKKAVRARDTHIAILGHITEEELRARLRGLEIANGLGNRFLFFLVERSKRIPDGHGLDPDEAERLGWEWRKAIEPARRLAGPLKRTREAEDLWRDWYLSLDDDRPGMLGALLARPEAHVLRLSLTYALADGESAIDVSHLRAALAVWAYSERSAFVIFGDAVGDPVADLILRRLRDCPAEGMTRTEIRDALGRHEREVTIEHALDLLESRNLASCERTPTGGRPVERWFATSVGDESDQTRQKGSSVASVASVAGKVRPREAAFEETASSPRGDEESLSSASLNSTSDNRHLISGAAGEDDLHDLQPTPTAPAEHPASDEELRRWAAEETP